MSGALVSVILLGAMAGAAACAVGGRHAGRRTSLLAAAVVFVIGAVAASAAQGTVSLMVARFVLGIAVGVSSTVVPLYISETAPPSMRGRLITVNQLMITIGIVVSYGLGIWLARLGGWRTMFLLIALPGAALFVFVFMLPESPRWLRAVGRAERAEVIIRTRLPYLGDALNRDRPSTELSTSEPHKARLLERWLWPALIAGIGLQLLGQLSGVNTVIYYAPIILKQAGIASDAAEVSTLAIGVLNCAMTIVGMIVIDRIGRKKLLVCGASIMAVSLLALAAVHVFVGGGEGSTIGPWLPIALVLLYICAVAGTLNTVVFVIPAEIYPAKVRTRAMGLTIYSNWSMNFIVALTFLPLLGALGYTGTFVFYGAMCVALGVFGGLCIPETRGRTLEVLEGELAALADRRAMVWRQP